MTGNPRQVLPADDESGNADRNVDQEDPAPAHGHQQPADDGPESSREAAHRSPGADRAVAALRGGCREHERQRRRREQRGPGGLDHPEGDEHREVAGGPAGRRGHGEDEHAQQEAVLAPAALGQPSEQHEQGGVDDRVGVEHPGQAGQIADPQFPRHVGQCHVDDEEVQAGQHDPGADDHEDSGGRSVSAATQQRVHQEVLHRRSWLWEAIARP
jgi:hypothetical protein